MVQGSKVALKVLFYAETSGKEPVREWLSTLDKAERNIIGYDIKCVQFGWPLGMPLVKPLGNGIWEVRSSLGTRIARVLFVAHAGHMILLHAFIKKSQKTPLGELELARKRAKNLTKDDYEKK